MHVHKIVDEEFGAGQVTWAAPTGHALDVGR